MGVQLPPMTKADPRWQALFAHACKRCLGCHPGLHPHGPVLPDEPRHEGHIGVRFGQAGGGWLVTLDGTDCTNDVMEADSVGGWVIAYIPDPDVAAPKRSVMGHYDHAVAALLEGNVTVTKVPKGRRLIVP